MGPLSSIGHRVRERLDAELSEKGGSGNLYTYGKVAVAAIVGNEDGAHHITSVLFQALNDVGFTIPAQGAVYWNGEAMHTTDYLDLDETPEAVASATKALASNAAHLARSLKSTPYPPAWVRPAASFQLRAAVKLPPAGASWGWRCSLRRG